jgi:hypothetical protein
MLVWRKPEGKRAADAILPKKFRRQIGGSKSRQTKLMRIANEK